MRMYYNTGKTMGASGPDRVFVERGPIFARFSRMPGKRGNSQF